MFRRRTREERETRRLEKRARKLEAARRLEALDRKRREWTDRWFTYTDR